MKANHVLLEQHEGVETYSKAGQFALRCSVRTHIGKKRQENQDSYAIALIPESSSFLIADGMGGAVGGKTASRMCAKLLAEAISEGDLTPESLGQRVGRVNSVLHAVSRENEQLKGMG